MPVSRPRRIGMPGIASGTAYLKRSDVVGQRVDVRRVGVTVVEDVVVGVDRVRAQAVGDDQHDVRALLARSSPLRPRPASPANGRQRGKARGAAAARRAAPARQRRAAVARRRAIIRPPRRGSPRTAAACRRPRRSAPATARRPSAGSSRRRRCWRRGRRVRSYSSRSSPVRCRRSSATRGRRRSTSPGSRRCSSGRAVGCSPSKMTVRSSPSISPGARTPK